MTLFYQLPSPHGHHHYETAQLAAFGVYVALLLGQGYRRGYTQRAWLPLVAAATLALVLGCQLAGLPLAQWPDWLRGDAAATLALASGPRSIVGGALASWAVVLGLKRALGFRSWGVFDAFAGPLCWALAVQSVGCVLAGCCWGQATAGGWGVAYGPGTPAYAAQLAQGLITEGTAHTLALVPTQLWQLLLCAGAGLVLHLTRRVGWVPGSRHLLGMGLLCLGRLGTELLRDPAAEPLLAAPVAGLGPALTGMEWLLLLGAISQLGTWGWLLRPARQTAPLAATMVPHPAAPALVGLGLLVATARLAPGTLALPEIATLQALLVLVLLAEGRTWLVALGRGVPRLAGLPLAALLGGLLLLSTAQAPAPQHEPPAAADGNDDDPGNTLTFSGGGLGTAYDEDVLEEVHRSCDGYLPTPNHTAYYHQTQAVGGEVAYHGQGRTFSTMGGGVWAGTETIGLRRLDPYGPFEVGPPDLILRRHLLDVHLYAEGSSVRTIRGLDVGYRLGVHIGELGHPAAPQADTTLRKTSILPELMVYVGSRRWLYGQFDAGYGAANALGAYTSRVALGSGLGQRFGSQVLVGYAISAHYPSSSMGFVSASLRVPGGSALSGLSLEPYYATDFSRHHVFSLNLSYRLGLGK